MKLNLTIGKVAKVPIILGFDWFLFVLGFTLFTALGSSATTTLNTFLAIMAISVIVLLHELGHMFMAKRFGAKTDSITLHCFGGVAAINMRDWPKLLNNPKRSLLVWFAGPAVNIALFFLLIPFGRYFAAHHYPILWHHTLYLMMVNFSLAVFNLLPVFPMDGGGMLYSVLRMFLSKAKAIRITSVVGMIGSLAFMVLAFKFKAVMLGVIAIMTFMSCLAAPKHSLYK